MSDGNLVSVFMTKDGPINVTKDMEKDRMWTVLSWALDEIRRRDREIALFNRYRPSGGG